MDTGYKDADGTIIKVGNKLYNPFFEDYWIVVIINNEYMAKLISSKYEHYESLEAVCDTFRVCEE